MLPIYIINFQFSNQDKRNANMWSLEKQQRMEKFFFDFMSDIKDMEPDDIDFVLSNLLNCSHITIRIQKIKYAIELMKTCKDQNIVSTTLCLHPADRNYIYT